MIKYFDSITGFINGLSDLPVAEKVKIYEENNKLISNFRGVKVDGKKIVGVVQKNYGLLQHKDFFQEVGKTLINLGLNSNNIQLVVSPNSTLAHAYIIFNDKKIDDDEQGIMYGIKLTNSYNKESSIRVDFYGFRIACSNQMVLRNLLSSEKKIHTGLKETNVQKIVSEMVRNVISRQEAFQELINKVLPQSFEWQAFETIFLSMLRDHKIGFIHASNILNKIGVTVIKKKDEKTKIINYTLINETGKEIRKWDLYNAFTDYISHNDLSYSATQYLEKLSERVLNMPTKVEQLIEGGE